MSGYGLVKVFKIVAPDGDIAYWATNDLALTDLTRQQYAEFSWTIGRTTTEEIKQCTERWSSLSRLRSAVAQRNHIGLALRAFLRLEYYVVWHPGRELVGGQDGHHPRCGSLPTLLIPGLTSQLRNA